MKIFEESTIDRIRAYKMGSHPFAKPKMVVYSYLVDGLMIDTGHSHLRRELLNATRHHKIDQLVITHHHEDHCGNANELRLQHHCKISASRRCIELVKNKSVFRPAQYAIWGRSKPIYKLTPLSKTISTDQYLFEIIDIPGHAEDMIGLYERSQGWFFSADLWVSSKIKYFINNESMLDQINSLKRMEELDISILFCSHNPQTLQIKHHLKRKRQFFEDFYATVIKHYEKGLEADDIMRAMSLKEQYLIKLLSFASLSTKNMVSAAIKDYHRLP